MLFVSSIFTVRLKERRNAIRNEALYLVEMYGLEARLVAIGQQREANSWSIARYWRDVIADVIRYSRPEYRDLVTLGRFDPETIESVRERRVRAQELARAIEFARTVDAEHRAGACPRRKLLGRGRRPCGFREALGDETFSSGFEAASRRNPGGRVGLCGGDRITAFPRRSRQ
jgi:hypothetical protein